MGDGGWLRVEGRGFLREPCPISQPSTLNHCPSFCKPSPTFLSAVLPLRGGRGGTKLGVVLWILPLFIQRLCCAS